MLRKCLERAFCFFVVLSLIIVNPHLDFLFLKTYALPSQVAIKGTQVNVRSGPGTTYKILGTVPLGYKLRPIENVRDVSGNGKTWYKFNYNTDIGYIRSDFTNEMSTYSYDATFEAEINMEGFPESYKEGLRDVHANYPNYKFKMQKINMDFSYAVDNEMIGTRTLVTSGAISSYKSTEEGKYDYTTSKWPTFDGNAWVCASREVTSAFMDPRNFLYDPYLFQFELQTFNPSIHTLDGIKEMVKGTFLDSSVETSGLTPDVSNTGININNNIIAPQLNGPPIVNAMPVNESSNIIYPGEVTNKWDSSPIIPILMNEAGNEKLMAFSNVYIVDAPGGNIIGPGANISNNNNNGAAAIIRSPGITNNEIIDTPTSFNYKFLPKGKYTYAELIYDACSQVNVNPYVIVSMIIQEIGKSENESVSGKNKKYKNYYNFGNINAYANNGLTAIESGLKFASETGSYNRPWNSKEKGIYGLCDFYANSYVKGGQDTFYLKKWNVQGSNMFKHQYMTNVTGAASEGQILGSSYDSKMLQMPHEFKIPVYNNMPETVCPIPTKDGSPNNRLKTLSVSNQILSPTFNTDTFDYNIIVDANTNMVNIEATAYDTRAAIGGIGNVYLNTSDTHAIVYCVAENGDIRQYNIHIHRPGMENNMMPSNFEQNTTPIIVNNSIQQNIFNNQNPGNVIVGIGPGQ